MNDETKDIQDMSDAERKEIAEQGAGGGSMLMDRQAFAQAYQVARLFSTSQLVPQHLQGKPHDCFIALHMANRLGEDPLMVMQNIVIVHGTAGWKAQWLIGRANRSGVFRGRIRFETSGSGDDLRVDAKATLVDTGEEVSAYADMKMAQAEGWTSNKKYQSMPQQMLSYRAASFLIRLYCPEATLGYQSAEEVEDMAAASKIRDVTPGRHTPAGGAEAALRDLPGDGESPPVVSGSEQQSAAETGDQQDSTGTTQGESGTGQNEGEPERDYFGVRWDERIHTATKGQTKEGRWKRRRGISDDYYNQVVAELIEADRKPAGEPEAPQEPTGAGESGDPGQAGEGSAPGAGEGAQQPPPGVDPETGETTAPSGDDLLGGQSGGEAPEDPPAGDSGDGGPPDSEIVTRIQRYLPTARKAGDLEMLADLEDEAREIRNDDWRQHMNEQLSAARQAIEAGAS